MTRAERIEAALRRFSSGVCQCDPPCASSPDRRPCPECEAREALADETDGPFFLSGRDRWAHRVGFCAGVEAALRMFDGFSRRAEAHGIKAELKATLERIRSLVPHPITEIEP